MNGGDGKEGGREGGQNCKNDCGVGVIEVEDAKGRKDMREKRPPLLFSLLCTQVGGKKEVAMNKKSVRLSERAEGITKEATANKRTNSSLAVPDS